MKTINKDNLPTLDYRDIKPFQGELKELSEKNYNKLLESFKKHGFFVPIFVWQHEGNNYCLDGHGRLRVLNNEGIKFENTEYEVPVIFIEADDIKDAKEKLLKITSQYQTITYEGLQTYIDEVELPEAEIYEAVHYDALVFIDQEQPNSEENQDIIPTISIYFKDKEVLENALEELVEMDFADKYEAEIKVRGDK